MNIPPLRSSRSQLFAVLAMLAVLAGCSSSSSSNLPVYTGSQVNRGRTAEYGTIRWVRPVLIETEDTSSGSTGGNAGSTLGRMLAIGVDPAAAVGAVAGSVVGRSVGRAAERSITRREGQEITLRLDDGTELIVVQENDPAFIGGERVRVVRSGSRVYVTAATGAPDDFTEPQNAGR